MVCGCHRLTVRVSAFPDGGGVQSDTSARPAGLAVLPLFALRAGLTLELVRRNTLWRA